MYFVGYYSLIIKSKDVSRVGQKQDKMQSRSAAYMF